MAVVLDANVLYPIKLCDFLLRLAEHGLLQPIWSRKILDEAIDALVRDGHPRDRIQGRFAQMDKAFPEAAVEGSNHLALVPEDIGASDRHVVATALASGATVIVTQNLRDFPAPSLSICGLDVQDPDGFLCDLWLSDPRTVVNVLHEWSADLSRPPVSPEELLRRLNKWAPRFVEQVIFSPDLLGP